MSYIIYQVICDKCHKEVTTSFGIVGTTQIASPIEDCDCGGKFKSIKWGGDSQ